MLPKLPFPSFSDKVKYTQKLVSPVYEQKWRMKINAGLSAELTYFSHSRDIFTGKMYYASDW